MYEIFEEYQNEKSFDEKNKIWRNFCEQLWSVPNEIEKLTKYISYKIKPNAEINIQFRDVFEKYKQIPYEHYRTKTDNLNSWFLLRQKINNLYVTMCDPDICLRKDYLDLLKIARKLYYRCLNGYLDTSANEVNLQICASLGQAATLKQRYGLQKMRITWDEYRNVINLMLLRCFKNYKPLSENECPSKIVLNIDFWMEDNYVVKYLGSCLTGYLKNYRYEQYSGIDRNDKKSAYIHCKKCGRLFKKSSNANCLCKRCSGYHRIGKKTLVCVDCGKIITVNAKNTKTIRCGSCQFKRDRERKRIWRRKRIKK